jgi:hypothetical protein
MRQIRIRQKQLVKLLGQDGERKLELLQDAGWAKPSEKHSKQGNIRWLLLTKGEQEAPPPWADHIWAMFDTDIPF